MTKAALAIVALLTALPATAQDWIEIAGFGGAADKAGAFMFIDLSRIQNDGSQFSAPYLEVNRKNYVERTITVSCNLKLDFAASQWRDRHSGAAAFAASATSQRLLGHAAGGMGGAFGAKFAPPRKQDLQLARWLCDTARPVGGTQFIRRGRDPKPAAWAQLDANRARLPGDINAALAQAAPSLSYPSPQQNYGVRSLRVTGCDLKVQTGTGLDTRVPLRYFRAHRSGSNRLVFTNSETGATVIFDGVPAALSDEIGYGLNSLKGDC